MRDAAAAQRYEEAASWRDRIAALENVLERSTVVLPDRTDLDLYGIVEDELTASIQLFTVRGGRVRGVRGWVVDKELELDTGTLVQQTLQQVYAHEGHRPASEIVVPVLPDDAEALGTWLGELRSTRVTLRTAQRGPKRELQETATLNAAGALTQYKLKRTADYVARTEALTDIQDALGMDEAPLRIESFDISHLQGTGIVGSMVVFEDGLPKKNHYRRFSIAESRDDTDSMHQVLTRRLAYLREDETAPAATSSPAATDASDATDATDAEAAVVPDKRSRFSYRPQLLLIDGGAPQVAAAQRALDESGVEGIAIAGIAKRLEELWQPGEEFPVILPRGSEALFLLQRVRDEAHRFAITHQRTTRKRGLATQLEDVPGLGPVRVQTLLKHFGSVKRLREADEATLLEAPGFGPTTARAILQVLHGDGGGPAPG